MTNFSVGSLSFNFVGGAAGQGFTPNVAGPGGSGSPGTASSVSLTSVIAGFNSSNLAIRSKACYILSAQAADPADPANDPNLVGSSVNSYTDGTEFGTGSYTRKYSFNSPPTLTTNQTYYFYFGEPSSVRCKTPSDYGGGAMINEWGDELDVSAQFKVQMTC